MRRIFLYHLTQAVLVPQGDDAALQLHQPLLGEGLEHPRHRLPRRADVLGQLLVGHADGVGAGARRLGEKELRQPPVKSLEQDLLHRPHHVGKPLGRQLVEKAAHRKILLGQRGDKSGGDDEHLRLLLGGHLGIKGDLADDAGRRQDAQLAGVQPEQRHLPPLVGEEVGAYLAGQHQQQPQTFAAAVVDERALFIPAHHRAPPYRIPLLLCQQLPEGQAAHCRFHVSGSRDGRSRGRRRCGRPRRGRGRGGRSERRGHSPDSPPAAPPPPRPPRR